MTPRCHLYMIGIWNYFPDPPFPFADSAEVTLMAAPSVSPDPTTDAIRSSTLTAMTTLL